MDRQLEMEGAAAQDPRAFPVLGRDANPSGASRTVLPSGPAVAAAPAVGAGGPLVAPHTSVLVAPHPSVALTDRGWDPFAGVDDASVTVVRPDGSVERRALVTRAVSSTALAAHVDKAQTAAAAASTTAAQPGVLPGVDVGRGARVRVMDRLGDAPETEQMRRAAAAAWVAAQTRS
jgi:hypothetical protein